MPGSMADGILPHHYLPAIVQECVLWKHIQGQPPIQGYRDAYLWLPWNSWNLVLLLLLYIPDNPHTRIDSYSLYPAHSRLTYPHPSHPLGSTFHQNLSIGGEIRNNQHRASCSVIMHCMGNEYTCMHGQPWQPAIYSWSLLIASHYKFQPREQNHHS